MAVLNSDHLFDQAERLIEPPPAGPPRQVDLRRAISSAYYGVFHFVLTAAADEFVGKTRRQDVLYALVYRRIDHGTLRAMCNEVRKQTPDRKYQSFLSADGLGPNIAGFASAVVELQEKRHAADYDPARRFTTLDAKLAIQAAREAVKTFERADSQKRKTFLTLLLFSPR